MVASGGANRGAPDTAYSLWNLGGMALPLVVGFCLLPVLYEGYGVDRMGVLLLVWGLVGYFGLFDLGLGRATTKFVSEALARHDLAAARAGARVGLKLTAGLGFGAAIITGGALWFCAPAIAGKMPVLADDTGTLVALIAAAIPLTVISSAARGILEATGQFRQLNLIRGFVGQWIFIGPAVSLAAGPSLPLAVFMILLGRAVGLLLFLRACREATAVAPERPRGAPAASEFLAFGSWVTVSNIVGPLLIYLDRYVIAGIISAAAVATYGAGTELTTKLLIFPQAIIGAYFPRFVRDAAIDSPTLLGSALRAQRLVLATTLVACVVVAIAGEPFVRWWLGDEVGRGIATLLVVLLFGIAANAQAHVPYAALQALGKARLTATNHLLEAPPYLALLWVLVVEWGVVGAAVAWSARMVVDALLLNVQLHRALPGSSRGSWPSEQVAFALVLAASAASYWWL
jgi:O-antigen/teichoic acid export membrane protein